MRKLESWILLLEAVLKFNIDEAAKGKPGLIGIGGVLHNNKGNCWSCYLSMWALRIQIEIEVMATLDAFRMYVCHFHNKLVLDSDSFNAITCVESSGVSQMKLSFPSQRN